MKLVPESDWQEYAGGDYTPPAPPEIGTDGYWFHDTFENGTDGWSERGGATVEKSSNKLSDIVKGSFSAGTFDFGRIKNTYASIGKLRSSGIAETQSRINNISNSTSKNINGGVNVTINQAKLDTDADVERMGEKLADIIIRKGMEWG